jgi:hypothetical protein
MGGRGEGSFERHTRYSRVTPRVTSSKHENFVQVEGLVPRMRDDIFPSQEADHRRVPLREFPWKKMHRGGTRR